MATARGLSHFGEHALGWMGMGALGALIDAPRRAQWVRLVAAAFVSHAISVVVKRIVRRKRPHDPRIKIGVGTPSKLSFPSSHATSTSAALVSLARITRNPLPLLGIPVMMVSRMVLGVHYPTDVATGALVGAVTAEAIARTGKVK
nr:phosphatase PAP2 family protein [Corynebacterium diphtheriae]